MKNMMLYGVFFLVWCVLSPHTIGTTLLNAPVPFQCLTDPIGPSPKLRFLSLDSILLKPVSCFRSCGHTVSCHRLSHIRACSFPFKSRTCALRLWSPRFELKVVCPVRLGSRCSFELAFEAKVRGC